MIRLVDVSKVYRMGEIDVPVLHGIDLEVALGEFLVVVGPSGSGKSTLLNIIGGLDAPTGGDVWFDDHNLARMSDGELTRFRRRTVGFVFQLYNLVPTLTAWENILVATEICPNSLDAMEALRLVGLAERAHHFPSQMSGGEQQRVAIARAVAKQPRLLLCDEPTGALDLATGKPVLELLCRLNQELGMTSIVITHNIPIARLADRIVRLGQGTIVEIEHNAAKLTPQEIAW